MKLSYIPLILIFAFSLSAAQEDGDMNEVQMYSSYYLAQGDTLTSETHIKIYVGDATIDGVLNGKQTLYAGNVTLGADAVVNGGIACFGGKVIKNNEEAVTENNIHVANIQGRDIKSSMKSWLTQTRN